MAFFLVDLEFRKKARQLITSKELYLAIFFAIFAVVSWSEVLSLLDAASNSAPGPPAATRPPPEERRMWKEDQVALLADQYEVYLILVIHFVGILLARS